MLIANRMTSPVVTITQDERISDAAQRMADRHVHQLPVVRAGDRLAGIITDRDVRAIPADQRSRPVASAMTANPITVSPGDPLEEALLLLHRHRFGALPVVLPAGDEPDGLPRLVGIITHTDILSALIQMLGVEEPGTRLEIDLPQASAAHVCSAVQAIADSGTRLISMIVAGKAKSDEQRVYLRLSTIDPRPAIDALADAGYRVATPYCEML